MDFTVVLQLSTQTVKIPNLSKSGLDLFWTFQIAVDVNEFRLGHRAICRHKTAGTLRSRLLI